jgi:hypothetical protein
LQQNSAQQRKMAMMAKRKLIYKRNSRVGPRDTISKKTLSQIDGAASNFKEGRVGPVIQEKKPRRRVPVPLDLLVGRSRDRLCKIGSDLTREIFPLSSLPDKRHHQQIAHAISAINLAQGILRDVQTPNTKPNCEKGVPL